MESLIQDDADDFEPALQQDFGRKKFIQIGVNKPNIRALSTKDTSVAMRSQNKPWVHSAETLLQGHILYNVKFLGECEVDHPKGTEIIKDAIRKMKFNKHIKKAEGQKPPKVELAISADGVTIQDPKTKIILHQNPLHRISYCADDKSDKRMFTFIAKAADSNKHYCYVFDSEKCAEEITLTVGQAFDLAYRRFVETTGRDIDVRKQFLVLQKQVNTLQSENDALKKRIAELEKIKDKADIEQYKMANNISDLTELPIDTATAGILSSSLPSALSQFPTGMEFKPLARQSSDVKTPNFGFSPPQTNGTHRMQPLLSPPPTKPRASSNPSQHLAANPPVTQPTVGHQVLFGSAAAESGATSFDPFGMGDFNPSSQSNSPFNSVVPNQDLDKAIQKADKELMDLKDGFSRGLSFGTDDFSLDDLDPLNQK